jgi:allantoinase
MLDLAIKGATLVTEQGTYAADLGVEGDRIAAITQTGGLTAARREIAADGCLLLPGAIDIHFHVRAPGHPQRGTFITETQAAAAGGVTTVLEMPISVPGCARRDIFANRKRLGEAESYVNFGLYGAPGLLERDEVLGMAELGACGYKIFTHATPKGRADEFLGICLDQEDLIYRALELIKESGRLVVFHAENERLIQLFEGRARATGRKDPAAFVESRPPVVEAMSVAQIAVMCADVRTQVHIAHVSCAAALDALIGGQKAGLPMTGETCPHYLLFTAADMDRLGPYAMIKPPLRTPADQEALWQGLFSGALLAITTDHSPFTVEEKERGVDDIWAAAIGSPGVEALVPFVLSEALGGRMSLAWAVRLICGQPARLFNLYPERGTLQVGSIADLLVYAPAPQGHIDSSRWFSKAKAIDKLYNGRPVHGHVHTTVVNGTVVYEGGQITAQPGTGRFVRPSAP